MRPTALRILLSIILIVLVASGCGRSTPNALTMEVLKNAEYQSEFTANGRAKLTNGTYKEKILPDSATEVIIKLGDQNAIGDLNGDGAGDAAAILIYNSGGSGTFRHLAAVLNQKGAPKHVASELLGDRVKIKSVSIESGQIAVEMLTHGPGDPMPSPSLSVTRTYRLQEGKLVLIEGGS